MKPAIHRPPRTRCLLSIRSRLSLRGAAVFATATLTDEAASGSGGVGGSVFFAATFAGFCLGFDGGGGGVDGGGVGNGGGVFFAVAFAGFCLGFGGGGDCGDGVGNGGGVFFAAAFAGFCLAARGCALVGVVGAGGVFRLPRMSFGFGRSGSPSR